MGSCQQTDSINRDATGKQTMKKARTLLTQCSKYAIVSSLALGLGLTISTGYADDAGNGNTTPSNNPSNSTGGNTGGAGDSTGVIAAINALSQRVAALSIASQTTKHNNNYQTDTSANTLPLIYADNHNIHQQATVQASTNTQTDITNTLQQFPEQVLTFNTSTPDVVQTQQGILNRQMNYNALSLGTKASDTLYSDVQGLTDDGTGDPLVTKPTQLDDNAFNFSNLFSASAYDPEQLTNAKKFIQYISRRYEPLTTGIDFSTLQSRLNSMKPADLNRTLNSFVQSDAYKKYQLAIRSLVAARSVALNNFNRLVAERTPIYSAKPQLQLQTLSTLMGYTPKTIDVPNPNDPSKPTQEIQYPSPLQISNYLANHRVNDTNWYRQVATASPATVQRKTLYLLAEIESMMQRNHLDNERILATLSTMALNSSQGQTMMLRADTNDLNQEISSLVGNNNGSQSSSSSSNSDSDAKNNAEKAKQAASQYTNNNNSK